MRDPGLELQVDELCALDTNREPTETEMFDIYCWIDSLEFSRPKKNIARDFSDGGNEHRLFIEFYRGNKTECKNF